MELQISSYKLKHCNCKAARESNLTDVTTNDQWICGNDNKCEPPV